MNTGIRFHDVNPMEKKKILFICGSLNQTMMMHKISAHFPEYDSFFTPYYLRTKNEDIMKHLLDFTILGGKYRKLTEKYLHKNRLNVDERGISHQYDFVFTCQDLIIQKNIKGKPIFLVQEGMTDPQKLGYFLVKNLHFPRWIAGTSVTGLSDAYDLFFVASEGYRELFIQKGVNPSKIRVTGIPNFDNAASYLKNDFPYRNYALVATSNLRECLEYENRKKFIQKATRIAGGRQLVFKLHPSENAVRASREIKKWAPGALVFPSGNTNHMIANCDMLITRYSSVVYIALALDKEVHAELPLPVLQKLTPIQNGGTSAKKIADLARTYLESKFKEYSKYHLNAAAVIKNTSIIY